MSNLITEITDLKGIEKRILCARFYERIKIFYENPENRRRFEAWKKQQEEMKNASA